MVKTISMYVIKYYNNLLPHVLTFNLFYKLPKSQLLLYLFRIRIIISNTSEIYWKRKNEEHFLIICNSYFNEQHVKGDVNNTHTRNWYFYSYTPFTSLILIYLNMMNIFWRNYKRKSLNRGVRTLLLWISYRMKMSLLDYFGNHEFMNHFYILDY